MCIAFRFVCEWTKTLTDTDLLFSSIRDVPYFRGLLRAVEAGFYQGADIPAPTLDIGCGDGFFAGLAFGRKIEAGVDPAGACLREAHRQGSYRLLVQADGARLPFPGGYFASAFSNSVLEHIPHVQPVLDEISRVLKPGAPFYFCVPNHQFLAGLSLGRFLDRAGLKSLAGSYRSLFNRISRHHHCDDPGVWSKRLKAGGFVLEKWWHYFSPSALRVLEWGHYFGLPAWIVKKLTGRWILCRSYSNHALILRALRRIYLEPVPQPDGAYTFFITRRL